MIELWDIYTQEYSGWGVQSNSFQIFTLGFMLIRVFIKRGKKKIKDSPEKIA